MFETLESHNRLYNTITASSLPETSHFQALRKNQDLQGKARQEANAELEFRTDGPLLP